MTVHTGSVCTESCAGAREMGDQATADIQGKERFLRKHNTHSTLVPKSYANEPGDLDHSQTSKCINLNWGLIKRQVPKPGFCKLHSTGTRNLLF